ncbi:MAG: hypothetical protein FWB76_04255, partial [Oscillospiraceae bacterium]|nr:hypothetical protein [Oscillospiraceae bacterium]
RPSRPGYCDCDGDLNECLRPSRPGYCDCDDDLGECNRPVRPGYCDCRDNLGECNRPIRPGDCDCGEVLAPCACDNGCPADCSCNGNCPAPGDCGEYCECYEGTRRRWWQVLLAVFGGVTLGVLIPLLMFLGGRAIGNMICWAIYGC